MYAHFKIQNLKHKLEVTVGSSKRVVSSVFTRFFVGKTLLLGIPKSYVVRKNVLHNMNCVEFQNLADFLFKMWVVQQKKRFDLNPFQSLTLTRITPKVFESLHS